MSARFITVPGDIAIKRAISSISQKKRLVVCGHPLGLNNFLTETFEIRRPAEHILKDAESLDAAILVQELKEYLAKVEEEKKELDGEVYFGLEEREGSWEVAIKRDRSRHNPEFHAHKDNRQRPMEHVLMAEIEVENPWDVLAHFEYRVWYESLYLKEQCAMWRSWYEQYDAHVVSTTHEYLEAKVLKPPTTKEQAMELAWQHYYYCSDIVDIIADHAVSLLNSEYWYFWWD